MPPRASKPSPKKAPRVPADVWGEVAAEAEAAVPVELTPQSPLEMAAAQVERLRALVEEGRRARWKASDILKAEAELRAAIAARAKLVPDEEVILGSEAWARIEGALLDAVKGLPTQCTRAQVARALGEAMSRIHSAATPEKAAA